MPTARIVKVNVTRWVLPDPTDPTNPKLYRHVAAGTPGAVKVKTQSGTWYLEFKEGGVKKRIATGLTDKRAATKYLSDWHKAREHGQVGLTDPHRKHLDGPIREHVAAYLQTLRGRDVSPEYVKQVEWVLNKLIDAHKLTVLRDLTGEVIQSYFATMTTQSGTTKNRHRAYLTGFCTFLTSPTNRRMPSSPMEGVKTFEQTAHEARSRHPYSVRELVALVDAVRRYPVESRTKVKGGRPRKDGTPAQVRKPTATLTPAMLASLNAVSRERVLMYRVLVLTSLRRGELSRVECRMLLNGGDRPRLDCPAKILKVRRRAVIPLPASLATDLRTWIKDTNRKPTDAMFNVPDRNNLIRQHKAALTMAGIPYIDCRNRRADIHACRKTMNTLFKSKDIPEGHRRRFLRHSASGVTQKHYDTDAEPRPTITPRVLSLLSRLDARLVAGPQPAPAPQIAQDAPSRPDPLPPG